MGAFEYTALDAKGKNRKGVMEGDTARQVRQALREQGMTPLIVDEAHERERPGRKQPLIQRSISAMDLALITRQIATLLHSGMPLEEVLHSVGRQSEKPRIQKILLAVRSRIREGHSFSAGLADFPNVFPELYRKTVTAGEQSGYLDNVLERLADYTENRQVMQQKTVSALFYPAMLIFVSILIVTALLTYVVPQVVQVFDNVAKELPAATRFLIGTSEFLQDYGWILLIGLLIIGIGFRSLLRKPEFRMRWDRFLLRLPLVGRAVRGINTARFARTLSILTTSNVQILEALRIAGQVVNNMPMQQAIEQITIRVREGSSIHSAMEKSGYFPPMTVSLIASGEGSGNLEKMLEQAAKIQEREMDVLISTLLNLLGPLLILFMGGIVLFIVMAILLPVFDLNQLVG